MTPFPLIPFYLIRHGESEANVARTAAGGGVDTPLTDRGREQARTLKAHLSALPVKPSAIVHSTLSRAAETALILNEALDLKMTPSERIVEHYLGAWEGVHWDIVGPKLQANEVPENGESMDAFAERIGAAFSDMLLSFPAPLMIVAHGGVFHCLERLYGRMTTYGRIENCHLHFFEPEPAHTPMPWRIWHFNVTQNGFIRDASPICPSRYVPS